MSVRALVGFFFQRRRLDQSRLVLARTLGAITGPLLVATYIYFGNALLSDDFAVFMVSWVVGIVFAILGMLFAQPILVILRAKDQLRGYWFASIGAAMGAAISLTLNFTISASETLSYDLVVYFIRGAVIFGICGSISALTVWFVGCERTKDWSEI